VPEFLSYIAALVATLVLTPVFASRAARWGLLDHPDARKHHGSPVPQVGGLAMGVAFLATLLTMGPPTVASLAPAAAIALTLAGGVLDDRHDLSARVKFGFQIVAALIIALGAGAQLTHLGHLMSGELFTLGRWALPFTVFAIVGVMNALNMADGIDGLAGSLALTACIAFGVAGWLESDTTLLGSVGITAGVLIGFLAYNLRAPWRARAAVFMGDAGSLTLGLILAWIAIGAAMSETAALTPIAAVYILGIPIADTVTIMIRRAVRGKSPVRADREHLHHILGALGVSPGLVVAAMVAISTLLAAIGIAAPRAGVPEHVLFYIYIVGLLAYGAGAELACRRLGLRVP